MSFSEIELGIGKNSHPSIKINVETYYNPRRNGYPSIGWLGFLKSLKQCVRDDPLNFTEEKFNRYFSFCKDPNLDLICNKNNLMWEIDNWKYNITLKKSPEAFLEKSYGSTLDI